MVAPMQQMPPWLMQQQSPGMTPPWATNWAQAGAPPPPPPPVAAPNLWQQATGQMGQTPVWGAPPPAPPQPTTSWAQVPRVAEAPWQYQPASAGFSTFDYAKAAPESATLGAGQSGQAQLQGAEQTTSVPSGPGVGVGALGPLMAGAQANTAATGAAWSGQDYRLPSGEVLPAHAHTIINMLDGTKLRIPGYYEPQKDAGGFTNGVYQQNAYQWLQRRLQDAKNRGENVNDANVIYRELARLRDDAQGRSTGFVHLDRFIRGANGETGYTPGPGAPGPNATGTPPTVPPGAPGSAPGTTPPADGGGTGNTGGGTLRNFGQFQTDDLAFMLKQAADDPAKAAMLLRAARGQNGRSLGRMGQSRDKLYGNAFATALAAAGAEGFGGADTIAEDFLNRGVLGNNLAGYGSDFGRKMANMNFEGMSSDMMQEFLQAGMAMQGINMGSLGGAVQQGRLADIIYADVLRGLQSSGNDSKNFSDLLAGSPFQRTMQNFR